MKAAEIVNQALVDAAGGERELRIAQLEDEIAKLRSLLEPDQPLADSIISLEDEVSRLNSVNAKLRAALEQILSMEGAEGMTDWACVENTFKIARAALDEQKTGTRDEC